ncbi:unnamed protein product [Urochloa humidicola]
MAAMTESVHTYGHYVPLQPKAQSDDDDSSTGDNLTTLALIFVVTTLFLGFLYIMSFYAPVDPQISVRITGVAGLDDLRRPAVSPFFNLTIHVDNAPSRQQACRPNSVVIMYSGDDSIAWGEVPAFCVDKRSKVDLDVSLSSKRAILSRALLDRMASDQGGLDLSVEMKPINPEPSSEACLFVCQDVAPEPTACTQRCLWPYKKGTRTIESS